MKNLKNLRITALTALVLTFFGSQAFAAGSSYYAGPTVQAPQIVYYQEPVYTHAYHRPVMHKIIIRKYDVFGRLVSERIIYR